MTDGGKTPVEIQAEIDALEVAVENLDAGVHAKTIAELSSEIDRLQTLLLPPKPAERPCGTCNPVIICPTCNNPIVDGKAPEGTINMELI